jgi:hypothetical protein
MSFENYEDGFDNPGSNPYDEDGGDVTTDTGPASTPEELVTLDFVPSFQAFPALPDQQLAYLLLMIRTQANTLQASRTPLNICLVLDQSSSMRGEKLFQIKSAARQVVDQLTVADFFSLISFNDRPTTVVSCQKVSSRESIKAMIDNIEARGGTELATGLQAGIQEMKRAVGFTSLNYILLLTDGQTYGDADRCVQLGQEAARLNIVIYPMGVGTDWNEDLLETVAAKGGGTSEYIEAADQIVRVFMQKINQLRSTLAHTSTLSFQPVGGVSFKKVHRVSPNIAALEQINPGESSPAYNLGPLGRGSEYSVLVEMVLPACPVGSFRVADINLSFNAPEANRMRMDNRLPIGLNFAESTKGVSLNPEVRQVIERVSAFQLQARAWQEIEAGDIESGTKRLAAVSTRLLSMGQVDLAAQVQHEVENLEARGTASSQGKKHIKFGTRGLASDINLEDFKPKPGASGKKKNK